MDDASFIFIVSIIGVIIWTWILYEVIKSAAKSSTQVGLLRIQIRLLVKLLKHHGVDQQVIDDAISPKK